MRSVHFGLAAVIVAVFLVGYLESRPDLRDFDPARNQAFKDTWAQRVHLAYWEKWASFEGEACQKMVDEFNKSQSEIYVHYLQTSQVDRKASLAAVGGDPPDVVGLWDNNVIPFAEGGALVPLDDLMKESGLTTDRYIPNYLKLGQYRGKTWALPSSVTSVGLFWNKEHFRKRAADLRAAGLDPDRPPATIEELDKYAAVLNEFDLETRTPRIMGFLPTEPGWFNYAYVYWFGGNLADPATGALTPDDPANLRALAWAKRYAETYGREKLLQFRSGFGSFDSPYNAFIEGKVSMEMQGVWFPMFIRRHRPSMEFGVAPFPCAEGVPGPRSILQADVVGIPHGCKHPKEAWKFIYWMQAEGLPITARLQGKGLALVKAPDNFHAGHPNLELKVFEDLAQSPHSFILPPTIVWQEYMDRVNRAFDHVWLWPVPEEKLAGLEGAARKAKVEALCREEIEKTVAEVRTVMQEKLDRVNRINAARAGEVRP
jgi:ABC-type glycerol-3-phosphate transport system substrate-binding protein